MAKKCHDQHRFGFVLSRVYYAISLVAEYRAKLCEL
jgi:hypothetical protein